MTERYLRCSGCKRSRAVKFFYKRNGRGTRGYQSECKDCCKKRRAGYHLTHKAKNLQRVINYLQSHPCVSCGETDVRVLMFVAPRGVKSVEYALNHYPRWGTILEIIVQCYIRCYNCRERSAPSKPWARDLGSGELGDITTRWGKVG